MRLPSKVLLTAVLLLSAAGCARNQFKMDREAYEERAPVYSVGDSPATKRRLAVQDRLALAGQRLQSGDLVAAEREAGAVLKLDPGSADAHTVLAVVHDQRGEAAKAGVFYKRAAELAPTQGRALNNYGAWLCGNGYPAEALVWLDRAVAAPGYATPASALANAGGCALKAGQFERAERDLRRALALDPANAYALAAMAENEYRQGRYFEARAFSERRLAAAAADADVLRLAADIENKLGDKIAANRYIRRLGELSDPNTAKPGQPSKP